MNSVPREFGAPNGSFTRAARTSRRDVSAFHGRGWLTGSRPQITLIHEYAVHAHRSGLRAEPNRSKERK